MYFSVSAKGSCHVKAVKVLPVLLTVGDLFLDFTYGRFFSACKKRRKLLFAVGANIAVLKLAKGQHTDLSSANIAKFLFKKSHCSSPCIHIFRCKPKA